MGVAAQQGVGGEEEDVRGGSSSPPRRSRCQSRLSHELASSSPASFCLQPRTKPRPQAHLFFSSPASSLNHSLSPKINIFQG
ncbi:hypothetical protein QVD17_01849 [Tagetes erecta]|uniref:Uncharacterized protein n=1 Tax=Tagetes erecta TaxID=13708 RepID=A0AAD8L890_TARER|nr:hypothetical protein QVD17_01849 [Tagetes erecta]